MSAYKKDDIVRIVRCDPGSMIGPYLGSEAKVLEESPADPELYVVELDHGRPPRMAFIVREDMIEPDVTEAMLNAGLKRAWGVTNSGDFIRDIYRAMRAARRR